MLVSDLWLFARDLANLLCRVYFRLSVSGLEHVPKAGAYVIAPNHRSNLDIIVISACTRRRQRYMGKDTLWAKQPYNWILTQLGGFPVTRGTVDREALALIARGHLLVAALNFMEFLETFGKKPE